MNGKLVHILGKVILAAGWADQELSSEEIENLKDLLFRFQRSATPDPREDAMFEMYTVAPIEAEERERLVGELRQSVGSEEDKAFVIAAITQIVQADGKVTENEEAALQEMILAVQSVDTGIFGHLNRVIRVALQKRSQALRETPNREKYFEEFFKNKVYYEVRRRLDTIRSSIVISDSELRKLSLVGGMMAHVARIDQQLLEAELETITSILQRNWRLSLEAATFVMECAIADVSKEFDFLRMTREFTELTTFDERNNLLELLFAVANADGYVSNEELLGITYLADYLLLSVGRVNQAFLKVTSSQPPAGLPGTSLET